LTLYSPTAYFQSHPFREAGTPEDYIVPTLAEEESAECEFGEPIVEDDRAAVEWSAQTRLKEGAARSSPACRCFASTRKASSPSSAICWASG
jgi:hypothetical protein